MILQPDHWLYESVKHPCKEKGWYQHAVNDARLPSPELLELLRQLSKRKNEKQRDGETRKKRQHAALDNLIDNAEYGISHAIVFSNANYSREGNVEYMPIYFTMFFSHNPVPETMIYELPSFEQLAGKIHHA